MKSLVRQELARFSRSAFIRSRLPHLLRVDAEERHIIVVQTIIAVHQRRDVRIHLHRKAESRKDVPVPDRSARRADAKLVLDRVALGDQPIANVCMNTRLISLRGKHRLTAVRVEIQKYAARFEHAMSLAICLHRVGQRPCEVAADDDVERSVGKIKLLRVHLLKLCTAAERFEILLRLSQHPRRHVNARDRMPQA